MSNPGQRVDRPREEPDLEKRIREIFGKRFERLDSIQNASTVTQDDWNFLDDTKKDIGDIKYNNAGLPEGLEQILENLDALYLAACANADRVELVEAEGDGKKKQSKQVKEGAPVVVEEEGDEESDEEDNERPTIDEVEAEFADDQIAMAWLAVARQFEEWLREVENEKDPTKRRELINETLDAHAKFINDEYNPAVEGIEEGGDTIDDFPYMNIVGDRVDAVGARLEELARADAAEARGAAESREEIWHRFDREIILLHGLINHVVNMPMDTEDEVRAARGEFDLLKARIGVRDRDGKDPEEGYTVDWNNKVGPILDDMKSRKQRWGSWKDLVDANKALRERFFGKKAKSEEEESIEGVLQTVGRRLRERSKAILTEKWNEEFPNFSVYVAGLIINMQNARMYEGKDRENMMKGIQASLATVQKDWDALRVAGPRLSREARKRGERSVVHQYDVILHSLSRDIPALVSFAPKAKAARLEDVAYAWREALAQAEQFWNAGTQFRERIAFLKRYASGEAKDDEIEKMIRPDERADFEETADSSVLEGLRMRGKQRRELREEMERRERAQMYHPKLEWMRMDAKEAYRRAINDSSLWKDEISIKTRQQLFAPDAAVDDSELMSYVKNPETGIPAYRRYVGMVNKLYANVKKQEDEMYVEGRPPEEKALKAKKLRRIIDRYFEAEAREVSAWKDAKNARGWGVDPSRRGNVLHGEFSRFWKLGERAFEEEGFRRANPELRRAIVAWIFARLRLRTLGKYTQWLIDENPVLAQAVENMPRAFVVPEKEVKKPLEDGGDEDGEEGEVEDEEEIVSPDDKAALTLPVQGERTGDDAGGGAFTEMEEGPAADNSVGRDEEGEGSGASSEGGTEGRDAALEASGPKIVEELTQ